MNYLILIIIGYILFLIINYIIKFIDFKKFAKDLYYIDIKFIPFTYSLIIDKIKKKRAIF